MSAKSSSQKYSRNIITHNFGTSLQCSNLNLLVTLLLCFSVNYRDLGEKVSDKVTFESVIQLLKGALTGPTNIDN